ncbi:MAG: PepSY domain-containing protein [Clostridia bacterium]|nr:PepSY domain-containing protein [Clostridia bacterium]
MKKLLLSVLLIAALAMTALVGCQMPNDDGTLDSTAASVFTLDINPSVKIYLSEDETVIGVSGENEDGATLIAELELNGESYEAAVEVILDAAVEAGYAEGDETSVLVSVEKQAEDISAEFSEKINEHINKAFEKHGKHARIIEQEIDELGEKVKEAIDDIAERYDISRGKANVIEKIRGEFPELSEKELAELNMSDLALILGETGEDVLNHFKKFEKALNDIYVGAEAAVGAALADASTEEITLTPKDVDHLRAYLSRDDGKMIYEVRFSYGDKEYEYEIDAETATVIEVETEDREEIDVEAELDKFLDKHGDMVKDMLEGKGDKYKDIFENWKDKTNEDIEQILSGVFGKPDEGTEDKEIGRTEALRAVIEKFGIDADKIEKTEVKISRSERGTLVHVEIETTEGDEYEVLVEAYTATVIKAQVNGVSINVSTGEPEAEDKSSEG